MHWMTYGPVLDAMVDALAELGIGVEQVHAEAGTGQFEIVTNHADPVQVAPTPCFPAEESVFYPNAIVWMRCSLEAKSFLLAL